MADIAKRDANRVPSLLGVSSSGFLIPTTVAVDPSTHAMLVSASFSPSGTQDVNLIQVGGATLALGQQLAASSLPVVLTAAQLSTLTPSTNITPISVVSTSNSSTATLLAAAAFTGTGEEVKDYATIVVSVISNVASASDGLSVQQSSDNTNWDITDVYTIAAATGKTFSFNPAARYFRIVYTNGGTNQASFRLQTVFHRVATKASSQRSADAYTNETDLEQNWTFNSLYNGTTWDRMRGDITNGLDVDVTRLPTLANVTTVGTVTTVTTVSTVTNVSQNGGVAISLNAGVVDTGTRRVVQANGAGKTILSLGGSASSSGNNTIVAAGTNRLKVFAFTLSTLSTSSVTCIFQSGAGGTELWRVVLQAPTGVSTGANLAVSPPAWLFATASATLLNLNLSSANAVNWSVSYFDEA